MCKHCIKKSHPDRDDCCLDTGHYLLNHNACHQCGIRGQLRVDNKVITIENEDDEVEEKTTYDHVCDNCNHKAASHFYQFSVSIENGVHVQNFIMACALCGKGGDHRKLANEAEETKAQLEADLLNRSERANELADENEILEDQLCHLEGLEGQLSNLQTQLSNDFGADGEAKPDSWCVAPHDLQCQGLYSCTYVPLGRLLAVGICDELIAFNTSNVAILGSDFHHRPAVMTQIEAFILGHWAIFRSAKMQTDGVDDPALLLCRALLIQLKVRIPLRSVGFPAFCTIITTPGVECVTL